MAQYKVPQDVEADDKLIGPFGFRQFIYLLVVAALIALAWALAQVFPLLAIIPVLPAIFFLILALPLRKDQPMETYIAALIRFYTTPNKRFWNPGQRESTITITAPKIIEKPLARDISEEEAGRRLSFLANVVDSEGYSIKGDIPATTPTNSPVRGEILAEANNATDIYETYEFSQVGQNLESEADKRHAELVKEMRAAIKANNPYADEDQNSNFSGIWNMSGARPLNRPTTPAPQPTPSPAPTTMNPATLSAPAVPETPPVVNPNLVKLAGSNDISVASIAKQANRETSRSANDNEVYISLH